VAQRRALPRRRLLLQLADETPGGPATCWTCPQACAPFI